MQYINIKELYKIIDDYDSSTELLRKQAFVPGAGAPPPQAPPVDPATGQPMDPNAMPPGGAPPPGAMPPGAPPPGGDPNAMPPGGAPPPPGDPNAAPPGGAPPPDGGGAPPPQGGGIPPEVESAMSDLAGGMDQLAQTAEAQQQQNEQLSKRMLDIEQRLDQKEQDDKMKESAPFEGSTKTQKDVTLEGIARGI